MIEMTIATMGRRIKKFAMAYFPFASLALLSAGGGLVAQATRFLRLLRLCAHFHAGLHSLNSLHDRLFLLA